MDICNTVMRVCDTVMDIHDTVIRICNAVMRVCDTVVNICDTVSNAQEKGVHPSRFPQRLHVLSLSASLLEFLNNVD